jgi:hypothetical protein
VRAFMTLVHSALFAATLVGIAVLLIGCTVASIQTPAQASAAFQQQQLSEASRNLDADTIALFPNISPAERATCLRRANLIAIGEVPLRDNVPETKSGGSK